MFGVLACALILEATRRTVGWILPAICIGFLAYAYLGGLLPDWTGHRAQGLRAGPPRRPVLHGAGGHLRHPARRGRDLHRAVHALRRGARVLGRRALLRRAVARRVRLEPHRPGPDDDAGRLPARHRVGLGRRDDGDARLGHLAAAAQGGLPEERGRRRARRRRHRRDPLAADARRGRVHHRRVPGGELPQRPRLRDGPDAPLLPRRAAGHRGRRAALRGPRAAARDAGLLAAARPLRLPLPVAVRDRRAARGRLLAVPLRALRDRAGVPALVPAPARPDDAAEGVGGARGRRARRAADRGDAARRRG